jgi:hypothetical protein
MSLPTHVEMRPMTMSDRLKPRKTVVMVHPVSATIGFASTPRQ